MIQSVLSPPRWFKGDDGRFHMAYELMLTNAAPLPVNVASVQVLGPCARPVEALSGTQLEAAMSQLGNPGEPTTERPPATVGIVWLDLSYATRRGVPCVVGGECSPSRAELIGGPASGPLARLFGAIERLEARGSCRRLIAQLGDSGGTEDVKRS